MSSAEYVCEPSLQSESQVREQLVRILSSKHFNRSERLGRLLRFIVESALRNDLPGLKESVLGREVYDRGCDFDGRIDPIVRTEARRLRRKLANYYKEDGRSDSLRISVPKGAYVPSFSFEGSAFRPRIAGEVIGPYQVSERLAEGPSGATYRVRVHGSARELALKLLPSDVQANAELLAYIEEDVGAAAAVDHENVCPMIGAEQCDGQVYLISSFYDGESLEDRLFRTQPSWEECLNVARQILAGLAAAHSLEIVHGHLKPSNVLLGRSSQNDELCIKILNFGTRSLAGRTRLTPDWQMLGTTAYSPERERADARSDVWSAGAILYELLTGSLPSATAFHDWSSVPWRVVVPQEYRPPLAKLLSRCLATDPSDRFMNAMELNEAFLTLSNDAIPHRRPVRPDLVSTGRRLARFVVQRLAPKLAAITF